MTGLITDEIRSWIGRSESFGPIEVCRREIIKYSAATQQRLEKFRSGDEAPLMWLFGAIRPVVEPAQLSPSGPPTLASTRNWS